MWGGTGVAYKVRAAPRMRGEMRGIEANEGENAYCRVGWWMVRGA